MRKMASPKKLVYYTNSYFAISCIHYSHTCHEFITSIAPFTQVCGAMTAVCYCGFELIDHPSTGSWFGTILLIFISRYEKTTTRLAGKQYRAMVRSYLLLRTFFSRIKMIVSIPREALQHGWKKTEDRRGDYVEKTTHIWSNSTIASYYSA